MDSILEIYDVLLELRSYVDAQRTVEDNWRKNQTQWSIDRANEIKIHCDGVMKAVVAIEAVMPYPPNKPINATVESPHTK